jgi:hypothetical protein
MRFSLHLVAAALLVAFGLGASSAANAADRSARDSVSGREKIRAELSAALTKGYLTRMEQYHILLHAKEVLNDDDFRGVEQTLDRLAAQRAAARVTAASMSSEPIANRARGDGQLDRVTASKYEESASAEMPAVDPTPKNVRSAGEGSRMEEVPAGIGRPAMHLDSDEPEPCDCDFDECCVKPRWFDLEFFSSTDAFKGPIDIGDANGNFGVQTGVNSALMISPRLGIGVQAGASVILSDLKGTPYPSPNSSIRDQLFATMGMFQRITTQNGAFTWGFA